MSSPELIVRAGTVKLLGNRVCKSAYRLVLAILSTGDRELRGEGSCGGSCDRKHSSHEVSADVTDEDRTIPASSIDGGNVLEVGVSEGDRNNCRHFGAARLEFLQFSKVPPKLPLRVRLGTGKSYLQ